MIPARLHQFRPDTMILSIQYLRGLAALLVVLSHIAWKGKQYSTDPLSEFQIGMSGVDIFFVISGFIMCHATARASGTRRDSVVFAAHRIARILPLYWLLSALTLPIFLALPHRINTSGGTTEILNSFLLWPTDNKYLIQAGWTLSYEFFFYGIFGIGLLLGRQAGHLFTALILVALVTAGAIFEPSSTLGRFATDSMLLEFAYGIVIYRLWAAGWVAPGIGLIAIGAALMIFVAANFDIYHPRFRCFRFGVPALLLCYGAVCFESIVASRPINALRALGDSSYSLYLTHPFPLALLGPAIHWALGKQVGSMFVILLAATAIVVGWLVYNLVETRLTRYFKPRAETLAECLAGEPASASGSR